MWGVADDRQMRSRAEKDNPHVITPMKMSNALVSDNTGWPLFITLYRTKVCFLVKDFRDGPIHALCTP